MRITLAWTKMPQVSPEEAGRALAAAFAEGAGLLEKAVRERTPEGVGGDASGLRASIFSEIRERPPLVQWVTASSLPYAAPVEFGRKTIGAMPPVNALIPWVEKKIRLETGQTVRGVAWAIAIYIKQRGTRATRQTPSGERMFMRGWLATEPAMQRVLERHFQEAAPRLIWTGS